MLGPRPSLVTEEGAHVPEGDNHNALYDRRHSADRLAAGNCRNVHDRRVRPRAARLRYRPIRRRVGQRSPLDRIAGRIIASHTGGAAPARHQHGFSRRRADHEVLVVDEDFTFLSCLAASGDS